MIPYEPKIVFLLLLALPWLDAGRTFPGMDPGTFLSHITEDRRAVARTFRKSQLIGGRNRLDYLADKLTGHGLTAYHGIKKKQGLSSDLTLNLGGLNSEAAHLTFPEFVRITLVHRYYEALKKKYKLPLIESRVELRGIKLTPDETVTTKEIYRIRFDRPGGPIAHFLRQTKQMPILKRLTGYSDVEIAEAMKYLISTKLSDIGKNIKPEWKRFGSGTNKDFTLIEKAMQLLTAKVVEHETHGARNPNELITESDKPLKEVLPNGPNYEDMLYEYLEKYINDNARRESMDLMHFLEYEAVEYYTSNSFEYSTRDKYSSLYGRSTKMIKKFENPMGNGGTVELDGIQLVTLPSQEGDTLPYPELKVENDAGYFRVPSDDMLGPMTEHFGNAGDVNPHGSTSMFARDPAPVPGTSAQVSETQDASGTSQRAVTPRDPPPKSRRIGHATFDPTQQHHVSMPSQEMGHQPVRLQNIQIAFQRPPVTSSIGSHDLMTGSQFQHVQQHGQPHGPYYGHRNVQPHGPYYGHQNVQPHGPYYGHQNVQPHGPYYGHQNVQPHGPYFGQQNVQPHGPYYGQKYGQPYALVPNSPWIPPNHPGTTAGQQAPTYGNQPSYPGPVNPSPAVEQNYVLNTALAQDVAAGNVLVPSSTSGNQPTYPRRMSPTPRVEQNYILNAVQAQNAAAANVVVPAPTPGTDPTEQQPLPSCRYSRQRRRKRSESCVIEELEDEGPWSLVEQGEEIRQDGFKLRFRSESTDERVVIERSLPKEYQAAMIMSENTMQWVGRFGKGIGRFGIIAGMLGAAYAFQQGEYGRAAALVGQNAFFIGTDITTAIPQLQKAVIDATTKVITRSTGAVGSALGLEARSITRMSGAMMKAARFAVPFVGLGLQAYMIYEDLDRLSHSNGVGVMKKIAIYVNLYLDVAIGAAMFISLVFPPMEIVVLGLSIIRMTLESAVDGFKVGWEECESNHLQGIACSNRVIESGVLNILSGGYIAQKHELDKKVAKWKVQLADMGNVENYFSLEGDCDGPDPVMINFIAGMESWYGGAVEFKIYDDQTYSIRLENVPIYGEDWKTVVKRYKACSMLRDVFLGLGESIRYRYTLQSAKVLGAIETDLIRTVDDGDLLDRTEYGIYEGNNKNNAFRSAHGRTFFFDVNSECPRANTINNITKRLTEYEYRIYGWGGNDTFFLGPAKAVVEGNEGSDMYVIHPMASNVVIDNFAENLEPDVITFDVPLKRLFCSRDNYDLVINQCWESYDIRILNWFLPSGYRKFRHLKIKTKEIYTIEPVEDPDSGVSCKVVGLDGRRLNQPFEADLRLSHLLLVETVFGSNFGNIMIGNDKSNTLVTGKGKNTLTGNAGIDNYVIQKGSDVTIYLKDDSDTAGDDRIILSANFFQIGANRSRNNLVLSVGEEGIVVNIPDYFKKDSRRAVFITADHVIFDFQLEQNIVYKVPYILDYSEETASVEVNLKRKTLPGLPRTLDLSEIRTIFSSRHGDKLIGNSGKNMFICQGNGVYMEGGDEEDIYQISNKCSAKINTLARDGKKDQIVLPCKAKQLKVCRSTGKRKDLVISCKSRARRCLKSGEIRVLDWHVDSRRENFRTKTSDGIGIKFGKFQKKGTMSQRYMRIIDLKYEPKGHYQFGPHIDLEKEPANRNQPIFDSVVSVRVNNSAFNTVIFGNRNGNSIKAGNKMKGLYSYIVGREGPDSYEVSEGDGRVYINNLAEDQQQDTLVLNIPYDRIKAAVDFEELDAVVFDRKNAERTWVVLQGYWKNSSYRHLIIKSQDHVEFNLTKSFPYKQAIVIDRSTSRTNQMIQLDLYDSSGYSTARAIYGSHTHGNVIFGTFFTKYIAGGLQNDSLDGGPEDEVIEGNDGNDIIWGRGGNDVLKGGNGDDTVVGGLGNDVLYGGKGVDRLYGETGFDFLVFEGGFSNYKPIGVEVNLKLGTGHKGDAEGDTYSEIEGVMGTAFDDRIIDDDGDNEIRAGPGNDVIRSFGGTDNMVGDSGEDKYDLRWATGHKKIDNFDNSSDIKIDELVYKVSPEEYNSSFNQCTVTIGNSQFLRLNVDLTVELHDWYLSHHYQHLKLRMKLNGTENEKEHQLSPNTRTKYIISKDLEPSLNVSKTKKYSARININCSDCPKSAFLHQFSKATGNVTKIQVKSASGRYKMKGLFPGSTYIVWMTLELCDMVVGSSPMISVITRPNAPKAIRVFVLEGGHIQITWERDEQTDANYRDYTYQVRLTAKKYKRGRVVKKFKREAWTEALHQYFRIAKYQNRQNMKLKIIIRSIYKSQISKVVQKTDWSPPAKCSSKNAKKLIPRLKKICKPQSVDLVIKEAYKKSCPRMKNTVFLRYLFRKEKYPTCGKHLRCRSPIISSPKLAAVDLMNDKAMTETSVYENGDVVEVKCRPGFTFSKAAVSKEIPQKISCKNGVWTKRFQKCHETCAPPPEIKYGTLKHRHNVAHYNCRKETFQAGPAEFECRNNAWLPQEKPNCLPRVAVNDRPILWESLGDYVRDTGIP